MVNDVSSMAVRVELVEDWVLMIEPSNGRTSTGQRSATYR